MSYLCSSTRWLSLLTAPRGRSLFCLLTPVAEFAEALLGLQEDSSFSTEDTSTLRQAQDIASSETALRPRRAVSRLSYKKRGARRRPFDCVRNVPNPIPKAESPWSGRPGNIANNAVPRRTSGRFSPFSCPFRSSRRRISPGIPV